MQIELIEVGQLAELSIVIARMLGILVFFQALNSIPQRLRVILVIFLSLTVLPIVHKEVESKLSTEDAFWVVFCVEFFIGSFLGSVISMHFNVLILVANIISTQIGISSVIAFDPTIGEQSPIIGKFLSFLAIVIAINLGIHLKFISFFVESYSLFDAQNTGDIVSFLVNVLSESFVLAIKMSSAFIVSGTVLYIVVAILGRLAPQIQFFFLIMPMQIWLGLSLLALVIRGIIEFYFLRLI